METETGAGAARTLLLRDERELAYGCAAFLDELPRMGNREDFLSLLNLTRRADARTQGETGDKEPDAGDDPEWE